MNLKDKYNGIRQEVKGLMDAHPDGMPTDVAAKVTSLLEQADGLKAQIELADRAGGMADYTAPAGAAARTSWTAAGADAGNEFVDEKSWRETEYKAYNFVTGQFETKSFRWYVPERVDSKEYKSAMEAYLVVGEGRMSDREYKTLQAGVDADGGYLITADMQERILARMASYAAVRNYADVITTTRDSVILPRILGDSDAYPTEMRGTWSGELPAANAVRTSNQFGQVNIPVNTLMAELPVSRNLLEDAGFDLAGRIENYFGETFALQEDNAFINGTGVAQPRGMLLDVDATNGIVSVNSGASSTLTTNGMVDLYTALPPQYENNAVWVMSKGTEGAVRKLVDGAGAYAWPVYNAVGGLGAAPGGILGFPVVRDQFAPAVAAGAYPIIFGDLMGYSIADRVGISVQRLVEKYADQNIIGFLARKRVGGRLSQPERLRVLKVSA